MLKPIYTFPGYLASEDGSIWSVKSGKPKKLSPATTRKGTNHVVVRKDGKYHCRTVGSLVLEAFVGLRPKGMDCCHGPLGGSVDCLTNLSWGTRSKNNGDDKRRDKTMQWGERSGRHKLTDLAVRVIRHSYGLNGMGGLSTVQLGNIFHVRPCTIWSIVNRKNWNHI